MVNGGRSLSYLQKLEAYETAHGGLESNQKPFSLEEGNQFCPGLRDNTSDFSGRELREPQIAELRAYGYTVRLGVRRNPGRDHRHDARWSDPPDRVAALLGEPKVAIWTLDYPDQLGPSRNACRKLRDGPSWSDAPNSVVIFGEP